MIGVKDIRMKKKLMIFFLITGLVPLLIVGWWSVHKASVALMEQSFNQMTSIREMKKDQLLKYFDKAFQDMESFARSKDVADLYDALLQYHEETNVRPEGSYDVSTPEYKELYDLFGANVNAFQRETGYYDIFMICAKHGHVMYSASRESDLGTNLGHGRLRDSGLARVWSQTVQTKSRFFVDFSPYAPSNDAPAAFVGVPISKNGMVTGIMVVQISLDHINDIMQTRAGMGETGESYLVGADKRMRSDSFLDKEGHSVKASFAGTVGRNGVDTEGVRNAIAGKTDTSIIIDYNGNPVLSSYTPVVIEGITWVLLAEIDEAEVTAPIHSLVYSIIIVGAIIVVAVICLALLVASQIAGPLSKSVDFSTDIAGNDLTGKLDINQGDEIGDLSTALNNMSVNLKSMIKDIRGGVNTLSSSSTEMAAIADQMTSSATDTAERSNSVSAAAEEMNSNMTSVAAAMEEATTNVSTVAAATEEMSTNISNIVNNVSEAKNSTQYAVEETEGASSLVNELGQAAEEIGVVTETIKSISDKTNLLALNATIEAARAGDAGKGFAVVANEIKELAKQTADATGNIAEKLQLIQSSTQNTISGMSEVVSAINKVDERVGQIANAVEQQNSATTEISENVSQASLGLREINENVTQSSEAANLVANDMIEVNKGAREMSTSSAQVQESANELSALAEQLNSLVGQFKV